MAVVATTKRCTEVLDHTECGLTRSTSSGHSRLVRKEHLWDGPCVLRASEVSEQGRISVPPERRAPSLPRSTITGATVLSTRGFSTVGLASPVAAIQRQEPRPIREFCVRGFPTRTKPTSLPCGAPGGIRTLPGSNRYPRGRELAYAPLRF